MQLAFGILQAGNGVKRGNILGLFAHNPRMLAPLIVIK